MRIERVTESKLDTLDLEKVGFGKDFTDHMLICHYKSGQWAEPSIVPFESISLSPAAQVLHYGQAIFEGMKAYKDEEDAVFLFRPDRNFERMNKGAERMAMPSIPKTIFWDGIKTLVDLERNWIPKEEGSSLYIRPVLFASEAMITARASQEYIFIVFCSVARSYYNNPLKVKIEKHYSRAASGGVGAAKAAGNYAASFAPTIQALNEGFDQVIWTDSSQHQFIEEAGTMNVFFRIGDELLTAPINDSILDGVTRHSVLTLAKDRGYSVHVRPIKVEEVITALKEGRLKEAFGVGTAVVVHHFDSIGFEGEIYPIQLLDYEDSYGLQLRKALVDIQYNNAPDPFGWRIQV